MVYFWDGEYQIQYNGQTQMYVYCDGVSRVDWDPYHLAATAEQALYCILATSDDALALKTFLDSGWVEANNRIDGEQNVLITAIDYGRLNCVKYMLRRSDFDVNEHSVYGYTALSQAVVSFLFELSRNGANQAEEQTMILEMLVSDTRSNLQVDIEWPRSESVGDYIMEQNNAIAIATVLRGEKRRNKTFDHLLMHIATRKQPDKNELIHAVQHHVRPYLLDSVFTEEQHQRISDMKIE